MIPLWEVIIVVLGICLELAFYCRPDPIEQERLADRPFRQAIERQAVIEHRAAFQKHGYTPSVIKVYNDESYGTLK